MPKKQNFRSKYASMTQIGKEVGLSPKAVGAKLKELGLREEDGSPTKETIDAGTAVSTPLKDGTAHYMWDKREIIKRLNNIGIGTDLETVKQFKEESLVKETINEIIGLVESEEFEEGGKMYSLQMDYIFSDLLPNLNKAIREDLLCVRKYIHRTRANEETKEYLLELVLARSLELAKSKEQTKETKELQYIIDKTADWRTLEDLIRLSNSSLWLKELALRKMIGLEAPQSVLQSMRSLIIRDLSEIYTLDIKELDELD